MRNREPFGGIPCPRRSHCSPGRSGAVAIRRREPPPRGGIGTVEMLGWMIALLCVTVEVEREFPVSVSALLFSQQIEAQYVPQDICRQPVEMNL